MLTIALSKGRILDDTLPLLAEAGIVPTENPDKSRKLIIPTTQDDVRLLIVRATDVPTYVEHGAADLGVAGKDVLMEYGGQGLYEPLDLRIALCKLMTAGRVGDVFLDRTDGHRAKAVVEGAGTLAQTVLRTHPASSSGRVTYCAPSASSSALG